MLAADAHSAMRALPVVPLDTLLDGKTPLILAPHPDDESLGCGGLIAGCCQAGRPPLVAVLTDGTGSHPGSRQYPALRLRALREQETREAVAALGLPPGRLCFLGQRDTAAPTSGPLFEAVVDAVAALCRQHDVGAMVATWRHDPHCDHEAAHLIAAVAATRLGIMHLAYPVWGWTLPPEHPLPDGHITGYRLDIAPHLQAKHAAIQAHRSQYGGLITDDPNGFQLPETLLGAFDTPFETFLKQAP